MIDTSCWQEFDWDDFFVEERICRKLSKKDLLDDGITPVFSSETSNNGILGYTDKEPDFIINDECPFMIVFGDHTKAMSIAEQSFVVMDNVKVLKPKKFNKNAIMFITTVWKKSIPDRGYSRHWSDAKGTKIKLPVKKNGSPDWKYMEKYMSKMMEKTEKIISDLCSGIN